MLRITLSSLIAVVMLFTATNQSEEIVEGVVTPMPDHYFQGAPSKDWPVTKIHVKVGDKVKAGDCLIELDPALLPQGKAKAQWDSAKLHLEVLKSRLTTRECVLGRHLRLLKSNAASQQECDECTEAVEVLKRELAQGEADERAAQFAFKMAKYDYDVCQRISSMVSGEVIAIRCSLGLVARAETRQIVWIEVLDSSRVHIVCAISPQLVDTFRQLMDEKVSLSVIGTDCTAKVVAVPRIITNGKFDIILEVDNPNFELVCGQRVKLCLPRN